MELSDAMKLLDNLRWNWGEAYRIIFFEPDKWSAERRDTHETLRASTPLELRDLIVADYAARKVARPAP
jgi:hypothetical protein